MNDSGFRTPCRSPWALAPSSPGRRESGGAAVEFALVLPVLIMILFGIFDFGRAFLTMHGLSAAAREGARLAIAARPVTDSDVEARVQLYLAGANVDEATISVLPSATGAESGTAIAVSVTRTFSMSVLPISFELRGNSTMVKE